MYKDGKLYTVIDSFVSNTGEYYWTIPNDLLSGDYQIKISSSQYDNVYSFCEGYIRIEESVLQRLTLLLIIVVVIIVIVTIVFKMNTKVWKKKKLESAKKAANQPQFDQPQMTYKEITQEQYDQIWEGYNQ